MLEHTELPAGYRAETVSDGSLKTRDFMALIMILVMTLGPLAFTAYQNPYTQQITAVPNVPVGTTGNR